MKTTCKGVHFYYSYLSTICNYSEKNSRNTSQTFFNDFVYFLEHHFKEHLQMAASATHNKINSEK